MRCATASEFKKKGRRRTPLQAVPNEGTRLRLIFDFFQSNKGHPVEWTHGRDTGAVVKLTDFYGLDIRCVQKGDRRTGRKSIYVLAGEWFGKVYVDYIAEQLQ